MFKKQQHTEAIFNLSITGTGKEGKVEAKGASGTRGKYTSYGGALYAIKHFARAQMRVNYFYLKDNTEYLRQT